MCCQLVIFFNTLRPRQNGSHFRDDIFKYIFLNENARISIKISPKFAPQGPINNIPTLVQIMACRRLGDKPFSEPMMASLMTHICVTRPQWVNGPQVAWRDCRQWVVLLTHWGWVTHICVGKLTTIGSDNGLSPGHCQAITWTNVVIYYIVNWKLRNKFQYDFNQNSNNFIEENTFGNVVCEMLSISSRPQCVNTLRPRQNGRHFADDPFKRIFLNENVRISIKFSLKFVP